MPYQDTEVVVQCLSCKGENLVGEVTIKKLLPLAKRNGTVKIAGQTISQIDLKNAWAENSDGSTKRLRGPVYCEDCLTEMHWSEDRASLVLGSIHEEPSEDGDEE